MHPPCTTVTCTGSPSHEFWYAQSSFQAMLIALLLPRPNWSWRGTKHSSIPFWQEKAFTKPSPSLNYILQLLLPTQHFFLFQRFPALTPVPTRCCWLIPIHRWVPLAGPPVGQGSLCCLCSAMPGPGWHRWVCDSSAHKKHNLKTCRNIKAISVTQDEAFVLFN